MKHLITLLVLVSSLAQAGSLSIGFGKGTGDTKGKDLSAAYRLTDSFLSFNVNAGMLNTGNIRGGEYNPYIGADVDLRVNTKAGIYVTAKQGVAILDSKTSRLDNQLQFPTTIEVGLTNDKDQSIGVRWKHYSSGGTSKGNKGQEYISIAITFPL